MVGEQVGLFWTGIGTLEVPLCFDCSEIKHWHMESSTNCTDLSATMDTSTGLNPTVRKCQAWSYCVETDVMEMRCDHLAQNLAGLSQTQKLMLTLLALLLAAPLTHAMDECCLCPRPTMHLQPCSDCNRDLQPDCSSDLMTGPPLHTTFC